MEPTCFEDYGFSLIEKFVSDLPEPLWVKVTGGDDAGTEFLLDMNSPAMVSGIRGIAGAGVDLHPDMICPEMTKPRDDGNYLRIWVETNDDDVENSVFYMAYADIQEAYQQRMLELGLPIPGIPANFHE